MPNIEKLPHLPSLVILELTKRCNNKCLYCYTPWGEPSKYDADTSEMPLGEIKKTILKLQEELPLETIGLSGGEPLLREDLPDILSFISERNLNAIVITNGTLLTEEKISKIVNQNIIFQITLLSVHEDIHDQLAGRKGAWKAALDGMIALRKAKAEMVSVFIATKLNYADLQQTAELAIVLGAKGLMYNRMNLGAHNIRLAEELLPTSEMIIGNLETLENLGKRYGLQSAASVVLEPSRFR